MVYQCGEEILKLHTSLLRKASGIQYSSAMIKRFEPVGRYTPPMSFETPCPGTLSANCAGSYWLDAPTRNLYWDIYIRVWVTVYMEEKKMYLLF